MTVNSIVVNRNIHEVVHFTTNKGLIGILNSGFLKARSLLGNDDSLEFILKLNSKYRSDGNWTDYVNLSITKINTSFFGYSENWHKGIHWCVLCFSASILCDEGVYFTSTNNIYSRDVVRGTGASSLEYLFADKVVGKHGRAVIRNSNKPMNLTTDIEAEVLYPKQVSIDHLIRIIVRDEQGANEISGVIHTFGKGDIDVVIDDSFFIGEDY